MFWETNFKKITILSLLSAVFLGIVSVGMDSPAKAESPNADNREVIGNPYSAESEEDEQDEETGQEEEQPAGPEEDEQEEDGSADD